MKSAVSWVALTLMVSCARAAAPLPSQFVLDFWGARTGLSEETIYSVKQTGDGYLWLGTANGLGRYDGTSFTVHEPRQDLGGAVRQEIRRMQPVRVTACGSTRPPTA